MDAHMEKINLNLDLTLYVKMNSKWITDKNHKLWSFYQKT